MQSQQNTFPFCPLEGQKPPQQNMLEYKQRGSWAISYLISRYSLALPLSACRDRYVTRKGHGKVFPARLARFAGTADLCLLGCSVSQARWLVLECPLPPGPQTCEPAGNEAGTVSGISAEDGQQSAPFSFTCPPQALARAGPRVQHLGLTAWALQFAKHCHPPGLQRQLIFQVNSTSAHLPQLTKLLPRSSHLGSEAEKAAYAPCTGSAGILPLQPWEAPYSSLPPSPPHLSDG